MKSELWSLGCGPQSPWCVHASDLDSFSLRISAANRTASVVLRQLQPALGSYFADFQSLEKKNDSINTAISTAAVSAVCQWLLEDFCRSSCPSQSRSCPLCWKHSAVFVCRLSLLTFTLVLLLLRTFFPSSLWRLTSLFYSSLDLFSALFKAHSTEKLYANEMAPRYDWLFLSIPPSSLLSFAFSRCHSWESLLQLLSECTVWSVFVVSWVRVSVWMTKTYKTFCYELFKRMLPFEHLEVSRVTCVWQALSQMLEHTELCSELKTFRRFPWRPISLCSFPSLVSGSVNRSWQANTWERSIAFLFFDVCTEALS